VSCSTLCVFVFQCTCGRVLLQASSITASYNNMFGFLAHYCGFTLKYVKTNILRSLSCVMFGMAGWNYTLYTTIKDTNSTWVGAAWYSYAHKLV